MITFPFSKYQLLLLISMFLPVSKTKSQDFKLMHNGVNRDYNVYVPNNLEPGITVPALIFLHGYSGTGIGYSGRLIGLADSKGFIGVFPTALTESTGHTMWNAGGKYEDWIHSDDIGFIAALIDTIIAKYPVDSLRIYVSGGSNGGFMAYRVAAELSHKVAAAAPYAGQMMYEHCNPEFTVPIFYTHGLADNTILYEGMPFYGFQIPPAEEVIATWCAINGCTSPPDMIMQNDSVTGKHWSSPDGKSDVELYVYTYLGHHWPTEENTGYNGNEIMWEFLSRQQLAHQPNYRNRDSLDKNPLDAWKIFPNPVSDKIYLSGQVPTPVNYNITDLKGAMVKTGIISTATGIDVCALQNGMYFLKLFHENTVWCAKIVKN